MVEIQDPWMSFAALQLFCWRLFARPRAYTQRGAAKRSADGHIRAAETNIAKVTGKTIVIPGHGVVGGKADLILFRDVLVEIRDKVAALKKQGKSLPEVVAAKPGARYDAEWGNLFQNPSDFVALVYQGV
jgi:hypothetical protein